MCSEFVLFIVAFSVFLHRFGLVTYPHGYNGTDRETDSLSLHQCDLNQDYSNRFAWHVSFWIFGLGPVDWDRPFEIFCLGMFAWDISFGSVPWEFGWRASSAHAEELGNPISCDSENLIDALPWRPSRREHRESEREAMLTD